jgi:hypothetical protein
MAATHKIATRATLPSLVGPGAIAHHYVRQGDIPDGSAKSKELFKKTSPAVDIAPLLSDALARFTRSGNAIESLAATQAVKSQETAESPSLAGQA